MSEELEKTDGEFITASDATEPEPAAPTQWQMPQPVFRQTSGYLPQGYERQFPQPEAPVAGQALETAADPPREPDVPGPSAEAHEQPSPSPPPAPIAIEPQPYVSEQIDGPTIQAVARPAEKRTALRIVMIILGLFAMLAFAIAFIVVVYFLFLAPVATETNL